MQKWSVMLQEWRVMLLLERRWWASHNLRAESCGSFESLAAFYKRGFHRKMDSEFKKHIEKVEDSTRSFLKKFRIPENNIRTFRRTTLIMAFLVQRSHGVSSDSNFFRTEESGLDNSPANHEKNIALQLQFHKFRWLYCFNGRCNQCWSVFNCIPIVCREHKNCQRSPHEVLLIAQILVGGNKKIKTSFR